MLQYSLFSDEELDSLVSPCDAIEIVNDDKVNNEGKLNNSNIIKNISYDQTEILHNIGLLYNNGSDQFDADMTASSLCFYGNGRGKYNIPEPKILMDVFPQREDIIKIENGESYHWKINQFIHWLLTFLLSFLQQTLHQRLITKKEQALLQKIRSILSGR